MSQRQANLLTASESFSENPIDMFSSMLKISLLLFHFRLFSPVDEILSKKNTHFTSFPKEIFSIYFENNRNSIESEIHELKNIESSSSLEHGPKSDKKASVFLKVCFNLC